MKQQRVNAFVNIVFYFSLQSGPDIREEQSVEGSLIRKINVRSRTFTFIVPPNSFYNHHPSSVASPCFNLSCLKGQQFCYRRVARSKKIHWCTETTSHHSEKYIQIGFAAPMPHVRAHMLHYPILRRSIFEENFGVRFKAATKPREASGRLHTSRD